MILFSTFIKKIIIEQVKIQNNPQHIWNMDESGLLLNNAPPKIVAGKGMRVVVKLTKVERCKNIMVDGCCTAVGPYIPPLDIFKGMPYRDIYK